MNIRKVLLIVKAALVLILVVVTIKTVMIPQKLKDILEPNTAGGIEMIKEVNLPNLANTTTPDCTVIINKNIFGVNDKLPATNANTQGTIDNEAALESVSQELGLSLLGTITGSPKLSRAVIKHTDNDVINLYKDGDIVGTARIGAIERDAVILLYKGKKKILRLKSSELTSENSHKETMLQNDKAQKNNTTITTSALSRIDNMRTKISRIEVILDKAKIEPYISNDQIQGLRLTELQDVPFIHDYGLRNNDIIQFVNGQKLTSKQKAFQVFKKARTQPGINIELLRDGETKALSFDLP